MRDQELMLLDEMLNGFKSITEEFEEKDNDILSFSNDREEEKCLL